MGSHDHLPAHLIARRGRGSLPPSHLGQRVAFTPPLLLLLASPQRENESEKAETREKVEEDRKPQIEAAVVRIMKSRKRLAHNELIGEVRPPARPPARAGLHAACPGQPDQPALNPTGADDKRCRAVFLHIGAWNGAACDGSPTAPLHPPTPTPASPAFCPPIAQVTRQLAARFLPQPQVIKKRIESLIGVQLRQLPAGRLQWVAPSRAARVSTAYTGWVSGSRHYNVPSCFGLAMLGTDFTTAPLPPSCCTEREFLERDAADRTIYVYLAVRQPRGGHSRCPGKAF